MQEVERACTVAPNSSASVHDTLAENKSAALVLASYVATKIPAESRQSLDSADSWQTLGLEQSSLATLRRVGSNRSETFTDRLVAMSIRAAAAQGRSDDQKGTRCELTRLSLKILQLAGTATESGHMANVVTSVLPSGESRHGPARKVQDRIKKKAQFDLESAKARMHTDVQDSAATIFGDKHTKHLPPWPAWQALHSEPP